MLFINVSSDDDSEDDEAFWKKFDDDGNLINKNHSWSHGNVMLPPTAVQHVVEEAQIKDCGGSKISVLPYLIYLNI